MEGSGVGTTMAPCPAARWSDVDRLNVLVPALTGAFRFAMVSQMTADGAWRWQTATDDRDPYWRAFVLASVGFAW
jgi:hypothetical protein